MELGTLYFAHTKRVVEALYRRYSVTVTKSYFDGLEGVVDRIQLLPSARNVARVHSVFEEEKIFPFDRIRMRECNRIRRLDICREGKRESVSGFLNGNHENMLLKPKAK